MNLSESTIEPPLSPLPLGGLRTAPAPEADGLEPGESPALSGPPPLPNRLLRMGLVTLPQLSAAMQQQAQTGRELTEILLENGLISAEDLAKLDDHAPAAPAPPPPLPLEPEPLLAQPLLQEPLEPLLAPPAEPLLAPPAVEPLLATPAPAPAPATALRLAVVAELENGSKLELATFGEIGPAQEFALQAMRAIAHAGDEWPLVGGRFVRPQSVVSIEITALM